MTQTKSFSVFSNLKSEDHLKGKRKQQKTALHSLLRTVVGGIIESIAATTTAILSFLLHIPNKQQKQKYQLHFLIPEFYLDYTGNSLSKLERDIIHAFGRNLKHTF